MDFLKTKRMKNTQTLTKSYVALTNEDFCLTL